MKYIIDGENQYFSTLNEVRNHISIQSDKDRLDYQDMYILCYKGKNYIGCKDIRISGKRIIFSRTIKKQSFE